MSVLKFPDLLGYPSCPSAKQGQPRTCLSTPTDSAIDTIMTDAPAPPLPVDHDGRDLYRRLFPHGHILQENPADDRRAGLFALQRSIRSQLTKQQHVRVPFISELSSIAQQIQLGHATEELAQSTVDNIHRLDSDQIQGPTTDDTKTLEDGEVSGSYVGDNNHKPTNRQNTIPSAGKTSGFTVTKGTALNVETPSSGDFGTTSQSTIDPYVPTQQASHRKAAILPSTPFSLYELDLILQLYGKSLDCATPLRLGWIAQGRVLNGLGHDLSSLVVVFFDPDSRGHWTGVRQRDPAVDGLNTDSDEPMASLDDDDDDDNDDDANPYRTSPWLPKHRDDSKCYSCFRDNKKCYGKSPCFECQRRMMQCRPQDPESTAQMLDAAHKPRLFDHNNRSITTDPCATCFRSREHSCDGVLPCNNCRLAGIGNQCNRDHKTEKKAKQRTTESAKDQLPPLAISNEERYCSGCGYVIDLSQPSHYSRIENHRHEKVCRKCGYEENKSGRHSSHSQHRTCWYCFAENVDARSFTVALADGEEGNTWCPTCRRLYRQQTANEQVKSATASTCDVWSSNLGQATARDCHAGDPATVEEWRSDPRRRCHTCGTLNSRRWCHSRVSGQQGIRWCENCYKFWLRQQVDPYYSPAAILARTGRGVVCAGHCRRVDDGSQRFSLSKLDQTKFWCLNCSVSYGRTGRDPAGRDDMKCFVCGNASLSQFHNSRDPDEQGEMWCLGCLRYWQNHDGEHPRMRPEVLRARDRQRMLDLDTEGSESDGA
ncbi:hypothetical protein EDD37DRAFT_371677 [Exophiala viscosa]|uniref:uncharacterized protein n=1 Tax=Exophiala viscosa TaxID=2486360 RepID=UPI0021929B2D|nr:hypothetical protein EDD37DRAFT_371677 [Exophiala viscosa]